MNIRCARVEQFTFNVSNEQLARVWVDTVLGLLGTPTPR